MSGILFASLVDHATRQPRATAFSGVREVSYDEAAQAVEALARRIRHSGWQRLALLMENGPEWPLIDIAAQLAGVTLVPLPLFFSPTQLRHAIDDAAIEAVLCDHPPLIERLLSTTSTTSWPVTADHAIGVVTIASPRQADLTGVARVTYTSGTTGEPKGVPLRQQQIDRVATSLLEASEATARDRHLSLLPLSTLLENIVAVHLPLRAGARCHLPPLAGSGISLSAPPDPRRFAATLATPGITTTVLVPALLAAWVALLEAGEKVEPTIRFVAIGGAPLADELRLRAESLGVPLYQGYGLSECASVVTLNRPGESRGGSVGRPLPHLRVRIAADGEIEVAERGDDVSRTTTRHGGDWLATGDLGSIDGDGYLYLGGRKGSLIVTPYGRNLSPEWVEAELSCQPEIAQAALFGNERPWNCALIVAGSDQAAIDAAIGRVNDKLPAYARVGHWLAADEPFSVTNGLLTANGRLRREAIANRYRDRIDQRYQRHETAAQILATNPNRALATGPASSAER